MRILVLLYIQKACNKMPPNHGFYCCWQREAAVRMARPATSAASATSACRQTTRSESTNRLGTTIEHGASAKHMIFINATRDYLGGAYRCLQGPTGAYRGLQGPTGT